MQCSGDLTSPIQLFLTKILENFRQTIHRIVVADRDRDNNVKTSVEYNHLQVSGRVR